MMIDGQRDLIGYGRKPPDPRWPNEARIAVSFVLNIEEGSEYSIGDGDGFAEATVTEFDDSYVPRGSRDLTAESMFEYGSRVGVWRVLRLFEQYGLKLTLNACALAVESCCETTIDASPGNPSARRRSGGRPARESAMPKRGSASTRRAMA